jgi:uncharacterized protein (UPF0332 family)
MVKIDTLFKKKRISRIKDIERERYINFLKSSYTNDFNHCKKNLKYFPRWSIISGYYSMHNITKLFLAEKFNLKFDSKVHSTTIIVLEKLIENKKIPQLLEKAYKEFLNLSNDLNEAKENRVNVQYHTGTFYSNKRYFSKAEEFFKQVKVYLNKIQKLLK